MHALSGTSKHRNHRIGGWKELKQVSLTTRQGCGVKRRMASFEEEQLERRIRYAR
jgi:hypothetical protein